MVIVSRPWMLVQAHLPVVNESGHLPSLRQCVAKFHIGQQSLVTAGLALGIGADAVGTAKTQLFCTIEIAVGPLPL